MNRSCKVLGVLMGLTLGAVASAAVAGSEEDKAAITKVREMEAAAVNEANASHVKMIFAENVKYLPPNQPGLVGTDAVRGWLEALLGQAYAKLEYTHSDISVHGDWAFEHFQSVVTMTPKQGGETMSQNLRGIHIYERGKDGAWKITYDIWNTDSPAE